MCLLRLGPIVTMVVMKMSQMLMPMLIRVPFSVPVSVIVPMAMMNFSVFLLRSAKDGILDGFHRGDFNIAKLNGHSEEDDRQDYENDHAHVLTHLLLNRFTSSNEEIEAGRECGEDEGALNECLLGSNANVADTNRHSLRAGRTRSTPSHIVRGM